MRMMIGLEKRISGDWIDLREASKDQFALIEHLKISSQDMNNSAQDLQHAVEEGLLEYKNVALRRAFITLEAVQFQSVRFEELQAREKPLTELLFVILIQRLLCSGVVPLSKNKAGQTLSPDDMEVSAVLADIRERIKHNPGFQKHPAVKNVFVQLSIYQKEKKKMQELLPTIKEDKRAVFRANFGATFKGIFASIKKNYTEILREEESQRKDKESKQDLLYRIPTHDLSPFLSKQAQEVSRLRSTLAYAREDKYKTRSILVNLFKQRDDYMKLIENENRVYRTLCAEIGLIGNDDCAGKLNNRLREELIHVFERLSKVEQAP